MKAVEIFMIRKSFAKNSSEAIRQEAEDLINDKHYQGYRLINVDFILPTMQVTFTHLLP